MSYVIRGGTRVVVGQMSYFIIGGTNVGVGQMSGGTNVRGTNVGGTCVCGTKVAPPSIVTITFSLTIVISIKKINFMYFKDSFGKRSERAFEWWICVTEKEKLEVCLQIKQGNDCKCYTNE